MPTSIETESSFTITTEVILFLLIVVAARRARARVEGAARGAWSGAIGEVAQRVARDAVAIAQLTGVDRPVAAVRARAREIAVRMALGAEARRVHRSIVRRAMRLAVTGVIIGLAGGVAAGYLMASQLFGIQPADAATLTGVAAVILTVAWLAALLPARLAARIAPAEALKER